VIKQIDFLQNKDQGWNMEGVVTLRLPDNEQRSQMRVLKEKLLEKINTCKECQRLITGDEIKIAFCNCCKKFFHIDCIETHKNKWYHKDNTEGLVPYDVGARVKNGKVSYPKFIEVLAIAFIFYTIHTAIDSLIIDRTRQSLILEETCKLFSSVNFASAMFIGLLGNVMLYCSSRENR